MKNTKKVLIERKALKNLNTIRDISCMLNVPRKKIDSIVGTYRIKADTKDSSGVRYYGSKTSKEIIDLFQSKVYQNSGGRGGLSQMSPAQAPESILLDRSELATLLGISVRTINRFLKSPLKIPPSITVGNTSKWLKSSVLSWLEDQGKCKGSLL